LDVTGAVGVKFRLEAFYDFGIQTSGLDYTPFEIYVRWRLANAHLEVMPGRPSPYPPVSINDSVKIGPKSRCFAFDYNGMGRRDHIACYNPGNRMQFYGREVGGSARFYSHYDRDGNYQLLTGDAACRMSNAADRAFAFDYNSSSKLDHLVVYRRGDGKGTRGALTIFRHNENRDFEKVEEWASGSGINDSPDDRVFAFDYESSGKLDHLMFYRPGADSSGLRSAALLRVWKKGTVIKDVVRERDPTFLRDREERLIAYDYNGVGKLDHLVWYRCIHPVTEQTIFAIYRLESGVLTTIRGSLKLHGIGGYDLKGPNDRVFAFDYESVGKLDHLVFYRPGKGAIYVLKKKADENDFEATGLAIGASGNPGGFGGGWKLTDPNDRAFAFDFDGFGKLDHMVLYRPGSPGSANFVVLKKGPGGLVRVYG
jgi:hypothetical protein